MIPEKESFHTVFTKHPKNYYWPPSPPLFFSSPHSPTNTFTQVHAHSPLRPSTNHKPTQTIAKKDSQSGHEETHEEQFNRKYPKIRILIARPPNPRTLDTEPEQILSAFPHVANRSKARIHARQNPPASKRITSYCIASTLLRIQVFQLILHVLLKLLRQQDSTLHRIVDVKPVILLPGT